MGKLFCYGGIMNRGYFKGGKRHGITQIFDPVNGDGTLVETRTYKDDKKDGLWESYYENGQLQDEGEYKDGKKDGLWEFYNETGLLHSRGNYKDGKQDDLWIFSMNTPYIYAVRYREGKEVE